MRSRGVTANRVEYPPAAAAAARYCAEVTLERRRPANLSGNIYVR